MKRYLHTLRYLLGIHVLGLLFLTCFRLVQFFSLQDMMSGRGNASVSTAFVKGLWFDNVIACYIMILPLVVLLIAASLGFLHSRIRRVAGVWFGVLYAVVLAVSASNIPYFSYFFKNIDSTIFGWFGYAGTTAGMLLGEKSWWAYIGLYVVAVVVFCWLIRRWRKSVDRSVEHIHEQRHWLSSTLCLVFTIALAGLCVFGIRGRMGYNPIKISQAYYCDDPFLNQLGINPAFNLFTSTLDGLRKENKELYLMPYQEAVGYARTTLGVTGDLTDSTQVLRRTVTASGEPQRYNVVVILMESMSASLMQTFGQKEPLTPTLDSLYAHSLAFTHFYSAGIHTNHGITATLYSFPALMKRNLMKGTVTPRRQGVATVLKQEGYHNLFFMTHESQYDNMNAFLRTNGYDEIYSQESYPSDEVVNSFGVPDHYLFNYALPVINRVAARQKPFMATILTISNHPPYILPQWMKPRTSQPETQIVEYADHCLGEFLAQARRQPWYDHTVFVLLADHGKLVGEADSELPQSYNHIPCIIFGPGVEQGVYDGLATQVDVMPTLLGLLHMSYTYDGFGVDLLHERRDKVFYTSDTHIVARDSTRLYLYSPAMEKSFYYDVSADRHLQQTTDSLRFGDLRRYVFAMEQTAEYLQRHDLSVKK